MKIKTIIREHANDFSAIMECEYCTATWTNNGGYHDTRYHTQVIPALWCPACGLNRAGDMDPNKEPTNAT